MDDQMVLENAESQFITLSDAGESMDSRAAEQLSNQYTPIVLDSDNCQDVSDMYPLNDLLVGETFIIETSERPIIVNGNQFISFQKLNCDRQIDKFDNVQTISTVELEKSADRIKFRINSTDSFQDTCTNSNKTNSNDIVKTTHASSNLKNHSEISIDTDIDMTGGNYSNSVAIKILDDVAKSPIDTNGHFVCDLCLHEFHNWRNYKKHKLEHLNDKPFKCLKCLKSFNYNTNYLLHIASHSTNNLKCPQCKKEFKRVASFKSHLKIHKIEESITCNICYKIFDNQYRLDIHKEHCMQENIISLDNPTKLSCFKTCKTCKISILTVSEYKVHIKEHKKFNSVLRKQYKRTTKLKKSHKTSNLNKRFKCEHLNCDWSFNKLNLLIRHMRTHTGEKPFKCSYCSSLFSQKSSLNRHLLRHKGLRPFSCEFCKMTFSQKGHLINHLKRCHAVTKEITRNHKCSMCSCTYITLSALNKHLSAYHGLKIKKSNKNVKKNIPKSVKVDDINETINLIKDSSNLETLLGEVTRELQNSDSNTKSKKHCDTVSTQCNFELNSINNEDCDHIDNSFSSNIKSTSYQMDIENLTNSPQNDEHIMVSQNKDEQSFGKNDDLLKNQEKEFVISNNENELIPLSVQEIIKKTTSRTKTHFMEIPKLDVKMILSKKINDRISNSMNDKNSHPDICNTDHTNNKDEPKVMFVPNITNVNANVTQKSQSKVCQFCGKIFKKNADLERHKRIHTGDKPYKCDNQDCNKAFATKYSLEYHVLTHLGKMKRAVCPQCNGLFATMSSMKVHMRQHTGEKPFKCPVCGDAFRTSGHLHTHVIIHERKNKRK